MSKRKKVVLFLSVLVLAGIIVYGYRLFNERNPSVMDERSFASVTADELLTAFDKDEAAASRLYVNKVLSVRGMIRKVSQEEKGDCTVYLSTQDLLKSVSCSMDSLYRKEALSLKGGDSVWMKGVCTGYLLDVVMIRCVIEK